MNATTILFLLPAIWASYLINGDPTGLEDIDIKECEFHIKDLGECVNVSELTTFGNFYGVGYELAEFTFAKYTKL